MKVFRTKRHFDRLIFVSILFGLPILLFLDVNFGYRIILVTILIIIPILSTLDLEVDSNEISIKYPFIFFIKSENISWESVKKIEIVFRNGLTHGAMMPSYILFIDEKFSKKVNYKLSKEELTILVNIVSNKGVGYECKNNPYN